MKTSLTIFPCVLGSAFPIIRVCQGLSFATKRIGPPCCTLFTFVTCCSLQFILSQNYLLPLISVLAENTLLKTAYHFLLLLVGFDTLTYRKDYDRSAILVGHQNPTIALSIKSSLLPYAITHLSAFGCRCQNRRISGRGSRTVRLRRMVTGGRGHDVLPRFGPS